MLAHWIITDAGKSGVYREDMAGIGNLVILVKRRISL